ncbi:MAG TPA: TetR-like C-terminal domain-containing protein [Streptosporangiaceae bacterium]|nr:TetR-like C-terminal domain-containing protein [Streptosporangiaceae bacterium]
MRTGSIRPPPAPCTTRQAISDRPRWSDAIFRRAHERGEIDLDRLSPAVLEMPFDLPRHDMLMTLKRVPDERITSIVDDLFLPLVTGTSRR